MMTIKKISALLNLIVQEIKDVHTVYSFNGLFYMSTISSPDYWYTNNERDLSCRKAKSYYKGGLGLVI